MVVARTALTELPRRPAWHWLAGVAGLGTAAVIVAALSSSNDRNNADAGAIDAAAVVASDASPSPSPPPSPPLRCPDDMVPVPGGEFTMGSDADAGPSAERPAHRVRLSAFCIDETEVTVSAYKTCVTARACVAQHTIEWGDLDDAANHALYDPTCNLGRAGADEHPMNCVDWTNADAFCRWSGHAEGSRRLPTEAEWEYAARGTDGRIYPWGNETPDAQRLNACGTECSQWATAHGQRDAHGRSWTPMPDHGDDHFPTTAPVGWFRDGASPFGALNMAGNVWEWTADWWGPYQSDGSVATNPIGAVGGTLRVFRGGAWDEVDPSEMRAASRDGNGPTVRNPSGGFRCARGHVI